MYIHSDGAFHRRGPTPGTDQPPLVDNPFAPELLVTGFAGVSNLGGIIKLTLESLQCDHSRATPVLERVVVGRLALPIPAAQTLVLALNCFLEQQGFSPSQAAASGEAFQ
ncbi:hypothetical protein [Sphingomonas xinjiangensis]|uniref:Uncharacterized protein n=1 Tax=Sphingomonas xinjiangensis TaxID=643568 RepID=A0A840YS04_9SPHN|nr:hypothetical protein [Sphingomonas xinjiangensis]MBB5712459.1 hypothetical protein [Sphingomonas xinjiangensis]